MAGLVDKVKEMIGFDEEEFEDEYYEEEVYDDYDEEVEMDSRRSTTDRKDKNSKVVNLHNSVDDGIKVMIYEPKSYDEVTKVIDELKDRKLIVINMLGVENEKKSNLFHCLSGAIYAIEGNMQKVAKDIFVLAPSNIDVDSNKIREEIGSKGIFPWQK